MAWGCHRAEELRQQSPSTVWTYLNGSAGPGGYGSAATVYLCNRDLLVLCLPSPFPSSGGVEFWAPIIFLHWARGSLPHSKIVVLGDNLQVITLFDPSTTTPTPSATTDGTWSWAPKTEIKEQPEHIHIDTAWIKGHMPAFLATSTVTPTASGSRTSQNGTPAPPPPPLGTISQECLPIAHKVTPSLLHTLYPRHLHFNIDVTSSFDFYASSS